VEADVSLVRRARSGDQEALIQLIMNQKQEFYKLAYVYMKSEQEAMDALEDMIVTVYENIRNLKDDRAFYSWSKRILVNCCKQKLRHRRRQVPVDRLPEGSYEEAFAGQEAKLLLEHHWAKLSPKYQDVLRLRYYLDLEYERIAEILEIPLGTVKSRIHAGLQQLKASMGVMNE